MAETKKKNPGNRKGSDIKAAKRRPEALNLRIEGWSYRKIGAELKISYEQARRDVKLILAETLEVAKEEADELRQIENDRLDLLWETMYEEAIDSKDEKAVLRCIQISKARRELNGIDSPQQFEHSFDKILVNIVPDPDD